MKNQFSFNIKTPCQEDFNQFTATPNGGFCDACDKEVIDFTKMNTKDINNYFSNKNTQNTCGRFKSQQLDAFNQSPQHFNFKNIAASVGIACLSLFSITTAYAQNKLETTKNLATQQQNEYIVKGTVLSESLPLPGANVMLEGTEIGTVTDFDGNFEFPQKLKKGAVLIITYVGMDSQKVIIENKDSTASVALNVNMEHDNVILMGKVAVKEVYNSNRSK